MRYLFSRESARFESMDECHQRRRCLTSASGDAGPGLQRQRIWAGRGSSCGGHGQAGGDFPWHGAPNLIPEPAGSGSFLDGIMESIFEEFCLKGVDFTAGAEAAFVTTAAAFFKMRTLKVPAPKPSVETAAAVVDGASKGDAEEDPASAGGDRSKHTKPESVNGCARLFFASRCSLIPRAPAS